jgi:hypothetical protein
MNFRVVNLRPLRSGGNGDLYIGQRSDSGEQLGVKCLREFRVPHARRASHARSVS